MHVFPRFATHKDRHAAELVRDNPFALVVSAADGVPVVPTWNYAAVHLTGRVELLPDPAETLGVVERTTRALEETRNPAWRPGRSAKARFAELIPGVVAFRIRVRTEKSLFKLSQDRDDRIRGGIRDGFASGPYPNGGLARLMDEVDPRGGEQE